MNFTNRLYIYIYYIYYIISLHTTKENGYNIEYNLDVHCFAK